MRYELCCLAPVIVAVDVSSTWNIDGRVGECALEADAIILG